MVVMAVLGFAGYKVVEWGGSVTKLLGNHLRHDLADQTEVLKRIEAALVDNTRVTRAMGREILELRKELSRVP